MDNLALGKPALQSSTCSWSRDPDPARDAAGANNGAVTGEAGFHTAHEVAPWWQVDLGEPYLLRRVTIHNRRECAHRLRHFSILRSINGVDWHIAFRKRDPSIFGVDSTDPFVAEIGGEHLARFVRIRLDGIDCLHFDECAIFGVVPAPEDRFRLLEADVRALMARDAKPADRRGAFAELDGLRLFLDADRYAPEIIGSIRGGQYELAERSIVRALVRPQDRVLEIGTAIGVVSMVAAEIVGPENVCTYEANPDIAADARANFARNAMAAIWSHNAVLRTRAANGWGETVPFHVSASFWASRLDPGPDASDIVAQVDVPVAILEDAITAHRATVIVCDIEGGEAALFDGACLDGVRLVIMETHYDFVGEAPIDAIVRKLVLDGFAIDLRFSGNGMLVARRSAA